MTQKLIFGKTYPPKYDFKKSDGPWPHWPAIENYPKNIH